jgi:hypothetical protein
VVDVDTGLDMTMDVTTRTTVVNAAKVALRNMLGQGSTDNDIKNAFRHVILCLPEGTVSESTGNSGW